MFDIPVFSAPNFLNLTLTPSNQIIHPARIYSVFKVSYIYIYNLKNWDGLSAMKESEIPTIYEDFDDFSASML